MNFPILLLEISEIFTPKKRPLYDMCESVGLGETLSFQMFTWLLQTKALCTVSPEAYIAAASERTGVCNCVCLARARASFMRVSVVRRVCVRPFRAPPPFGRESGQKEVRVTHEGERAKQQRSRWRLLCVPLLPLFQVRYCG